jgi:hypothetical protein
MAESLSGRVRLIFHVATVTVKKLAALQAAH